MKNTLVSYLVSQKKRETLQKSSENAPLQNKNIYLFLNSNPWFSAISDYSLQLCLYLKKNNQEVLYGAEVGNTAMEEKCRDHQIPFFHIPIHRQNILTLLISFFKIVSLLKSKDKKITHIVTFEGREHTLLIVTKFLFPSLWFQKKLIRVRGQSQEIKNNFFSVIFYKFYTDKIIFAAKCVFNKVKFVLPEKKYIVQHYCKDIHFIKNALSAYSLSAQFPALNFEHLTFLVLGRYDKVKGHDMVVDAFLAAKFPTKTQLIFIGKSENINAHDMFKKYSPLFESNVHDDKRYFLEKDNKSFYIVDEKFQDISTLVQNVHFGIISSLDSEVICRVGVEYLQNGVPCLYSDAGALQEVFNSFAEFNFEKGDTPSLTKKMEESFKIFAEPAAFQQLKEKCRKIGYEKYHLDKLKNVFD